ncbi:MAG: hypothetical protein A3K40_05940 [Syntrophobacterales bacterium RIFOXYC2_FULL_60_23]|nr:MAG: hypothetical protein A3K53_07905 [Deltaproteobacteria bacterium RIFOXYB2_FULL_66_7]OHE22131.1 MAG: hypothetical protein A3K40_05940 [Syntrophobacterales bacterium RIFOXYC2_FULL_60_23]
MMSPANYEHVALSRWLVNVIGLFVEQRDLGEIFEEFQLRLPSQRRRRTPDLCFLAKDRLHLIRPTHLEGAPDLIFEIVSPDSQARDWREKYLEYEAAGVREYWVIDPMSQRLEAYAIGEADRENHQGQASAYRRLEPADAAISSTVLPGFRLRIDWLWPQTRPKVLDALRELGVLGSPPK